MSMRRVIPVVLLATVALAATSLSAVSSDGAAGAVTSSPHAVVYTVMIETARLGKVLANSKGHTLYVWTHDKLGKSNCTGQCAVVWPPLHVSGKPTYGPGVKASMFKVITRPDHTKQLAVNGQPLYSFKSDTKPKQTSGEGVNGFFAVHPNGKRY
jgi:predicted lipoprotein with Yx(FWY)xxD motif